MRRKLLVCSLALLLALPAAGHAQSSGARLRVIPSAGRYQPVDAFGEYHLGGPLLVRGDLFGDAFFTIGARMPLGTVAR